MRERDRPAGKRSPARIGDAVTSFLESAGLARRVDQAGIIPEWPSLVGPQIASVTEPKSIAEDGTLFVGVRTSAWMTELSLMEPQLLRALNAGAGGGRIARIRWHLLR